MIVMDPKVGEGVESAVSRAHAVAVAGRDVVHFEVGGKTFYAMQEDDLAALLAGVRRHIAGR